MRPPPAQRYSYGRGMPKQTWSSPRTFARNQSSFGRPNEAIAWRQPTSVDDLIGLRAAEVQHAYAVRVRVKMKLPGAAVKNQKLLSERSGLEYKRLGKILGGQLNLSLRDAAAIEAVLGPILLGLDVRRTRVVDAELRRRFPQAVGQSADRERRLPAAR